MARQSTDHWYFLHVSQVLAEPSAAGTVAYIKTGNRVPSLNAGTLAYSRWKIKESAELFQQHVSYFLTGNTFPMSNFLVDDYRTSPIGFTNVELLRQSWNVSKVFYIRKVFLERDTPEAMANPCLAPSCFSG